MAGCLVMIGRMIAELLAYRIIEAIIRRIIGGKARIAWLPMLLALFGIRLRR